MATQVTRKRPRTQADEHDKPPAKREPDLDNGDLGGAEASASRRRAEQQTGEAQVFKKDEEFWFDDGTVILVACDIEFRFYKGLLASVSPVFKQLFADCRAVRTVRMDQEQTFSCPVVRVSDSPEDLRYVLRTCASKRPGRLYDSEEREPSYQEISAAIRLGRKYKIAELYSKSMEFLQSHFPTTLPQHWTTAADIPPGWSTLDAIGIINLARLTGKLSLLPSAFVTCICDTSPNPNSIFRGNAGEGESSKEHKLSPNDLATCFRGKTALRSATIGAVFRTFSPAGVSPGCKKDAPACKTALSEVLLGLGDKLDLLLDGDPFLSFGKFIGTGPRGALGVCQPCMDMVRERGRRERQSVWARLPEILGIGVPGWSAPPSLTQAEGNAT
ncbi:hypothetical protein GSI_12022 [Ganoderma sinense ZZ0214-1]|uniref:BTB domain-containing protein n=1 Tax=Ganoderma sinense ZZ0214-1 TaxID=1077348 RepID=A0A2G8RXM2_9APHY|nr:hypothetical protein GSI_12022 [Ganoderma sinense ZZ0214-1]